MNDICIYQVDLHTSGQMGTVRLTLPSLEINYKAKAYFCLGPTLVQLKRQGKAPTGEIYPWLCITITRPRVPEYVHWIMIAVLLALSGLFSGLNLGILSLDKMDLKIMINTGTPSERAHAKKIRPIRSHGNLLLCSLLFSNVLVNTILTLLIDNLTDGITAVIVSTLAIVIIGEIIPQAVCCRYGLAVAGYTAGITKLFMIITFPMAFPVSKILDQFLGEEIGAGYTRERLKELVKVCI
jgi:metal transporter CNNM